MICSISTRSVQMNEERGAGRISHILDKYNLYYMKFIQTPNIVDTGDCFLYNANNDLCHLHQPTGNVKIWKHPTYE